MLSPLQLEQLPQSVVKLYEQVEVEILVDMAQRISAKNYFIPAAQWQYQKLIEMGNVHSDILKSLSALTGSTSNELETLLKQAGQQTLKYDDAIYKKAGVNLPLFSVDENLLKILKSGLKNTKGLFQNLTGTTAKTATKQFEDALDLAWLKVYSGAFDATTAIRSAIKQLAGKGIQSIRYPGGRTDAIDTSVRRAVLTGINQTALRLQWARADEAECDLVEVTAHGGARPEHAVWQGQIFSRSGKHSRYPEFASSTGYGTGAGLGGWNCRHSFYPFYDGFSTPNYTPEELEQLNAPRIKYDGKMLTEYEASQQQRYIERQLRRWKREKAAMNAAGLDTAESAAKIRSWKNTQKSFIEQTGFKRQYDREQIF